MLKWLIFFPFVLCLDFVSKIVAMYFIPPLGGGAYPFGGIPVFAFGGITCSLNYVVNTGAAWGLFTGHPGLLFLLRAGIIFGLLFFVPKRIPVWLVMVGAVGNVIDYCLYGHVIDFIHFTFWGYRFPIFNVADSCISVGVLSLLLSGKPKEARVL
jgi:signal peptidase II